MNEVSGGLVSSLPNSVSTNGMSDKQISKKLFEYITKGESDKFEVLAEAVHNDDSKGKEKKRNAKLDFIFNKWNDNDGKMPLLVAAAFYNNAKVVKTLLNFKDVINVDVEAKTSIKETALYMAIVRNNNYEMANLLLVNSADPNILPIVMYYAVRNDNLAIVRLLLKYNYDWDTHINTTFRDHTDSSTTTTTTTTNNDNSSESKLSKLKTKAKDKASKHEQSSDINSPSLWKMNIFHLCCYHGLERILKYLFEIEINYKTKINIFSKTSHLMHIKVGVIKRESSIGATGLVVACSVPDNNQIIQYLIDSVYNYENVKQFIITQQKQQEAEALAKKQKRETKTLKKLSKRKIETSDAGDDEKNNEDDGFDLEATISSNDNLDGKVTQLITKLCNKKDYTGNTPLLYACLYGDYELISILVSSFGDYLNINRTDRIGQSPLIVSCKNNESRCVKQLLQSCDRYNKRKRSLSTRASRRGAASGAANGAAGDKQEQLQEEKFLTLDGNLKDNSHKTALMYAIEKSNVNCVNLMCDDKYIENNTIALDILDVKDASGRDALDYSAYYGEIACFHGVFSYLLRKSTIHSWKELNVSGILHDAKFNKWLSDAKSNNNQQFIGFLINLQQRAIKSKDLELLYSMMVSSRNFQRKDKEKFQKWQELFKSLKQASYLYENCDKNALQSLSKAINKALLTQECGFDDSLLFLCKMVDSDELIKNLQTCTIDCLGKQNGKSNFKKYLYYEKNLLSSKIWGLAANSSDVKQENEDDDNQVKTVYDSVRAAVIENELKMQQKFIRDSIIKEEKEFEASWNALKTKIGQFNIAKDKKIRQNKILVSTFGQRSAASNMTLGVNKYNKQQELQQDQQGNTKPRNSYGTAGFGALKAYARDYARLAIATNQTTESESIFSAFSVTNIMEKKGIQSDYKSNELPYDNVNGYDGASDYDLNGYLTRLVLASAQIDPIFQRDCQHLFNPGRFGIDCKYTGAPPKTKDRAQFKAEQEYNDTEWPHTASIVDLVRCSVVFNNSDDILNAYNKFISIIENKNSKDNNDGTSNVSGNITGDMIALDGKKGYCIKRIVRIKNGFSKFNSVSLDDDKDLKRFKYGDLKFNVICEYNNIRIVGEIQFLLDFMLEAKKRGHSIYAFMRQRGYYDEIYNATAIRPSGNKNTSIGGKSVDLISADSLIENQDKTLEKVRLKELENVVMMHNISLLYSLLENCTVYERSHFWLKNKSQICAMFQNNKWHKGEKLYNLFVEAWTK